MSDKFKEYVHHRLDEAGVDHDPNPEKTKATGCRIGNRLDEVLDMGTLLTSWQKRRFAVWLETEIAGDKAIIRQLEKMNTPEVFVTRRKAQCAALMFVLQRITSTESETIHAKAT